MPRRPLPTSDEILDAVLAGASGKELAAMWGVSPGMVCYLLRREGLRLRKPTSPMPSREELAAMVAAPLTIREIAMRCGVSYNTAKAWLIKVGLPLPDADAVNRRRCTQRIGPPVLGGGVFIPPAEDLRHLRDQGVTVVEIGKRYGVSPTTVSNWFDAAGIRPMTPRERVTLRRRRDESLLHPLFVILPDHKPVAGKVLVQCRRCQRVMRRYLKALAHNVKGCGACRREQARLKPAPPPRRKGRPTKPRYSVGDVIGSLTVIQPRDPSKPVAHVLVRCACGREKSVAEQSLRRGSTRSCGCAPRPRKERQ